jgi:cache domain-containing protein
LEFHRFLQDELKSLPQANAIVVVNAAGKVVNFSRRWPIPDIDISDRDFFRQLRNHDQRDVLVTEPVTRSAGTWSFYLVRRVNGPGGEFLGIIQATIEVQYLQDFFAAITLQRGGSVTVLRQDGMILARYPDTDELMGKKLPAESQWYARVAAGGGTFRTPIAFFDGSARVVAVHPLKEYPLVVDVSILEAEVLNSWRRQSSFIVVGAICAVIGFGVLFRILAVQFGRLEDQARALSRGAEALRDSEQRFRDYAASASDWYWETGPEHSFTL